MFRRVIWFVLFLVLVGGVVGAVVATGLIALTGAGRWVVVGLTLAGIVGFALLARVMFGRAFAPVGELIDATTRVGEGETGVRLQVSRPGPFAAVSAAFNRMAERLEADDERRRRLLADIGHELRTPMTVIRGEIEAVLDGVHPADSLSNVVDEVELMDRLLEDLRVLALAEAGSLELETAPTDLGDLAADVLASFARRSENQHVSVTLEDAAGTPEVTVDSHRIHQVLSNLVSNALDQMPDGGRLSISIGVVDQRRMVRIDVDDTGPGIDPSRGEEIFDRFVRATDSSGAGLGLSISRDLAAAHRGSLELGEAPGGGARFTMHLPIGGRSGQ
ncbi:MAG: ATP-binding protein [Acidimicrobiia bacterium]